MKLSTLIGIGLVAAAGWNVGTAINKTIKVHELLKNPYLTEAKSLRAQIATQPEGTTQRETLTSRLQTVTYDSRYLAAYASLDDESNKAVQNYRNAFLAGLGGLALLYTGSKINQTTPSEEPYTRRRPSRSF